MKKITGTLLAGIVGVVTALSSFTHAQSQQLPVKNIVLVHGAFADGTSWAKVIPILEVRGFHVVAVQNPLTSLSADVDATRRIIAMQDGPVILVGHSWGGAVISEVGDDPKVARACLRGRLRSGRWNVSERYEQPFRRRAGAESHSG